MRLLEWVDTLGRGEKMGLRDLRGRRGGYNPVQNSPSEKKKQPFFVVAEFVVLYVQ